MNLFELIIEPKSAFGTPLKGDTLFGQLCWKIEQSGNLLGYKLEDLLKDYDTRPFVILSSAFLRNGNAYIMKIPALPLSLLFPQHEDRKKKKELKKKKWLIVPNDFYISMKEENLIDDRTLFEEIYVKEKEKLKCGEVILQETQFHNTINRLWGTTGEGEFAPYDVEQEYYLPELEWAIFVGIDESLDSQKVRDGLEVIGLEGYGRDASTGLGKYEVIEWNPITFPTLLNANACYTLSPSVPEPDTFDQTFFVPFVRFGRHGDWLAKSSNPFKNPVIMADEGAVFVPRLEKREETLSKPYLGRGLRNLSKVMPETVCQGYSLYLPFQVEV